MDPDRVIRVTLIPLLALFVLSSLVFLHNGLRVERGLEPSRGMELLFSFGLALLIVL